MQIRMTSEGILDPNMNDILLGRGKTYHNHKGNQRFRAIIAVHLPKYADGQTRRSQKTKIVQSIVKDIYDEGCRFLKRKDEASTLWYDIGIPNAKKKVGHALRDASAEMRRSLKRADRAHSRRLRRSTSLPTVPTEDRTSLFPLPLQSRSPSMVHLPETISSDNNSRNLKGSPANTDSSASLKQQNFKTADDNSSSSSESFESDDLFPASEMLKYADIEPISIAEFSLQPSQFQMPARRHGQGTTAVEENDTSLSDLLAAPRYSIASSKTNDDEDGDFFSSLLGMLNQASSVMKNNEHDAGDLL